MRFKSKNEARKTRALKIRKKISGTAVKPRISIFRSNKHFFVQVIDDESKNTLVASSTQALKLKSNNKEAVEKVAKDLLEKIKSKKISEIVFDRSGYLYHGRVALLADKLREGGIKF